MEILYLQEHILNIKYTIRKKLSRDGNKQKLF